jgi:hypothetical protein
VEAAYVISDNFLQTLPIKEELFAHGDHQKGFQTMTFLDCIFLARNGGERSIAKIVR